MVGQYTTPSGAPAASDRRASGRGESRAEHGARQRDSNLRRAGLASLLLVAALSTGFLAGANSTTMASLFASQSTEALEASKARRGELRTGTILFASPDGESCRPMHFDNQTGELSPGTGTVPCSARETSRRSSADSKFNLRK
jgi:hypothetical protein